MHFFKKKLGIAERQLKWWWAAIKMHGKGMLSLTLEQSRDAWSLMNKSPWKGEIPDEFQLNHTCLFIKTQIAKFEIRVSSKTRLSFFVRFPWHHGRASFGFEAVRPRRKEEGLGVRGVATKTNFSEFGIIIVPETCFNDLAWQWDQLS